jgi:DNA-directed RNA polymerase subunit RPC12/RpoP
MSTKVSIQTTFEEVYICCSCGTQQSLKSTQPILCINCHSRIFRKPQTDKVITLLGR